MRMFLKSISIIVTIAFLWTNFIWADGIKPINKLAAHEQVHRVATCREAEEVGSIEGISRLLKQLRIESLADIVKHISALKENQAICIVYTDSNKKTAKYIFREGYFVRQKDEKAEVADNFYRMLDLLGIEYLEDKEIPAELELGEKIRITDTNAGFINSILRILSNDDPAWIVKPAEQKKEEKKLTELGGNQRGRISQKNIIAIIIGSIVILAVILGVGDIVYFISFLVFVSLAVVIFFLLGIIEKEVKKYVDRVYKMVGIETEDYIEDDVLLLILNLESEDEEKVNFAKDRLKEKGFILQETKKDLRRPIKVKVRFFYQDEGEVAYIGKAAQGRKKSVLREMWFGRQVEKRISEDRGLTHIEVPGLFSVIGILIAVGVLIYAFRDIILNWNLQQPKLTVLLGLGMIMGLYFLSWRLVFPVGWYLWRLKSTDKYTRRFARLILNSVANKRDIPALKKEIKNKDRLIRAKSADLLLTILKMETDRKIKKTIIEDYTREFGKDYEKVLDAYVAIGYENWERVVSLGKSAIPALKSLFENDKDTNIRKKAVECLGKVGEGLNEQTLREEDILPILGSAFALRDEDVFIRAKAANAMLLILDGHVGLYSSYDENYRNNLKVHIFVGQDKWDEVVGLGISAVTTLRFILLNDIERSVCDQTARALGEIGGEQAIQALRDGYATSKVPFECKRALAKLGEEDGISYLLEGVSCKDYKRAFFAKKALGGIGYKFQDNTFELENPREVMFSVFVEKPDRSKGRIMEFKERITQYMGKPITDNAKSQSQYNQIPEGEQKDIIMMSVNYKGEIGDLEIKGNLSKLARILGVDIDKVSIEAGKRIQEQLKKLDSGIFGAVKEIILVDNLGGLESVRKEGTGTVALLQNGTILIDIDAFRDDKVLGDITKHELWESILELVEQNPGVREIVAIYQNLKDFINMPDPEKDELIAFLRKPDKETGLASQGYGDLLQYVKDKKTERDNLILIAISYVMSEPRYGYLRGSLMGGIEDKVREAIEKLKLATQIYEEVIKAVSGFKPIINKVKTAELKAETLMKALKKAQMMISEISLRSDNIIKDLAHETKELKYIKLDVVELKDNTNLTNWLKGLLDKEDFTDNRKSPFILYSTDTTYTVNKFLEDSGIERGKISLEQEIRTDKENILTLNNLAKVVEGGLKGNTLNLPLFYSEISIYLAYKVVKAGGDLKQLRENDQLSYNTLMSFYKTIFGDEFTEGMLSDIINKGILPKMAVITEMLNALKEAIAKIETAA